MSNESALGVILTPTRELAVQVMKTLEQLLNGNPQIKTAILIGGEAMPKQFRQLKNRPRLIVGTPGRINDHLARGTLKLSNAGFLVLDETDRMLDMGFGIQIDRIVKQMPQKRQTLMFSATIPANIMDMAGKYLRNPVRISVGSTAKPIAKIKQENINTSEAEKFTVLVTELERREGSVVVFVKTKWGAEKLAVRLRGENHSADAIHGDLRQNRRDKVISSFRERKHRILVATDVAARGLDIPHIEHVVNYDMPQCPEDYIHRIGRTGRAGAEGNAVNLITSADGAKWKAIYKLMNPGEKVPYIAGADDAPSGKSRSGRPSGKRPFRFGGNNNGHGRGRASSAPRKAA